MTPGRLAAAVTLGLVAGSAEARADTPWYDAVALSAFADGYASFNYNQPLPQTPTSGLGGNQFRAFDVTNGFALSWAGVDASYAPAPVGGTIGLRFGPTAELYAGNDARYGLEYVKQALASWKPGGATSTFRLDFGKFDSPYGSEIADSQGDINYSRSLLFTYAQPLFFTGLGADWAPSDALDLRFFGANGWNNSVSLNAGKTVGAQVVLKPSDAFLATAGYAVGPQQADALVSPCIQGMPDVPGAVGCLVPASSGVGAVVATHGAATGDLRHMADVVLDATLAGKLRLLLNADFGAEQLSGATGSSVATWYGANLAVRYAFTSAFSLAVRGEYFADAQGWATQTGLKGTALTDGTATVGYSPTPNLVLKLEQRLDAGTTDSGALLFQKGAASRDSEQMTTMLGVVARTN